MDHQSYARHQSGGDAAEDTKCEGMNQLWLLLSKTHHKFAGKMEMET